MSYVPRVAKTLLSLAKKAIHPAATCPQALPGDAKHASTSLLLTACCINDNLCSSLSATSPTVGPPKSKHFVGLKKKLLKKPPLQWDL